MNADALLRGPRGRRAAFVVATSGTLSEALVDSIWGLTGELDPSGPERRYWRFDATESGSSFGDIERAEPEGARLSVDEVAAALLDEPIDVSLVDPLVMLDSVVESARYWQEPDGDDVLCALPALRAALLRAAEAFLSRPDIEWWGEPIARADQWAVDYYFDDPDVPRHMRPDIRTFSPDAMAEEEQARLNGPSDPTYPLSGAWWSTPLVYGHSFTTTRALGVRGPLGLHLVEDSMGWEKAEVYPVGIASTARIFEISTADDWAELCRRFPLVVTASRRHDWYRATGRVGDWVIPDWTAVGEHYDGVHLSVAAYLQVAGAPVHVDDAASLIAGWDPDQTWWFRPDVLDILDTERTVWERADGTTWRPRS